MLKLLRKDGRKKGPFVLRCCAVFAVLAAFVPVARAQAPGRLDTGHKLFQKNCSACHGSEAKGGRGPDLTTGHWKWGSSDADVLQQHSQRNSRNADARFPDAGG